MYTRNDYIKRKTEILIDNEWKVINFEDIKKDDIFRLFESDNKPVINLNNNTSFKALTDAYIDGVNGVLTVKV